MHQQQLVLHKVMDVDVLLDILVKLGWSSFSSSNLQIYVYTVS